MSDGGASAKLVRSVSKATRVPSDEIVALMTLLALTLARV